MPTMDVPPVQYATTSDRVKIAYRVGGSGEPLILMPFPFNNLDRMWRQHTNLSLYGPLLERFRFVHYDSRGQGLSSRGLDPDHSLEDYSLDLEAVVEQIGLGQFSLFAGFLSGHTAIRYAAAHPERVKALILTAMTVESAVGPIADLEELARNSWDVALVSFVGPNVRIGDSEGDAASIAYFRETVTQADFLRMVRVSRNSNIEPLLSKVRCPTLVVTGPMHGPHEASMRRIAEGISNARLVTLDAGHFLADLYTQDGSMPSIVPLIEDFMGNLPEKGMDGPRSGLPSLEVRLSPRELEVLSLVADGRTNREIAERLVISERTVVNHLSHIFTKTGVENRASAAAYAFRHGIV